MQHGNRGRGAHRWIHLCAVASLAIALSGCGGGSGSASDAAATAQSTTPPQQSIPTQTSTAAASPASTTSNTLPPAATSTESPPASQPPASPPPTATVGAVTLNWMPPTENVDGTPLTDLAGYDIHYGTVPGEYTKTISVSNPGIATYVVSDLTPGTYYFSVAAVNSEGTESPLSAAVSATVD